jgi:hypothetical protein
MGNWDETSNGLNGSKRQFARENSIRKEKKKEKGKEKEKEKALLANGVLASTVGV